LPDPAPAETNAPSSETASANIGTRQIYANPIYQPYYAPQGTPYTFQQYSNSYYIPNSGTNPYALPMTMQRYLQQVPARALPRSVR
jgi:hypothetical protein